MTARWNTAGDVRVVQFPHPGTEHDMSDRAFRPWQSANAPHRRTFMQAPGSYRTSVDGPEIEADVAVWAEWEAEARLLTELDPVSGGPSWLCEANPAAQPPELPDGTPAQNTDPFVFGDRFRYTACRQPGNRKLRALGRGSLILFGSSIGGQFVLDTVLVVAGCVDHTVATYRDLPNGATTAQHRRFTLDPWYGWGDTTTFRLYLGATPDDPVDGMFSFAPCHVGSGRTSGFARPAIDVPPYTNPNLRQQARSSGPLEPTAVARVWRDVVDCVTADGLALATRLSL
jgi:hypothetical protein